MSILGPPVSLEKITAGQLQYIVDKMADKLPTWQARMMVRAGRLELHKTPLPTKPIHAMMEIYLPVKKI